jgi:hypothetical protein
VLFGSQEVDLSAVEQFVEAAQARATALAIAHARADWQRMSPNIADALRAIMDTAQDLDAFQAYPTGELAQFRIFELAAFLNRIRGFRTL